jgi:hypothetical protein
MKVGGEWKHSVKCRMLLYIRMIGARGREGAFTAHLMKRWKIDVTIANPPRATGIPSSVPHFYQYAIDMTYIPTLGAI